MTAPFDVSQLRSVLIVKLSSIGDVVHALPVAVALRRRYPHLHITWVAEDWTAPLLRGHPAIDRVVTFPTMRYRSAGPRWVRSFMVAARSLRRERYDISLDLQGLMKSAVVAALARAPMRVGMDGQREGAQLVSRPLPVHSGRLHVVEDYLRCAEYLGAAPTPVAFALPVQPEATASIARLLSAMGVPQATPLIVINPSASALERTWAVPRWAQLASELSHTGTLIVVGNAAQRVRHTELTRQVAQGRPIYDLTGRTTLAELVALLDRCTIHIAPDTGSAHIAAALGRPVVGLYGPTTPWRKAPYRCTDLVVSGDGRCGIGCPRFCVRGQRCLPSTVDALLVRAQQALALAASVNG